METKEELKELIWNGIAADVFLSERWFHLFTSIGEVFPEIQEKSLSPLFFNNAKLAFRDQFLIATARLFDSPKKKYKTSCVQLVLDFLSKNESKLSFGKERWHITKAMETAGFDKQVIELLHDENNDTLTTKNIISHFTLVYKNPETLKLIKTLKTLRDKVLAHRDLDDLQEKNGITFKQLFSLVEMPKQLISILGWAYIDSAFSLNGKYFLTDDSQAPARSLKYLIENVKWKE